MEDNALVKNPLHHLAGLLKSPKSASAGGPKRKWWRRKDAARPGFEKNAPAARNYAQTIAHITAHKGTAFAFIPQKRDPHATTGPGLEVVGGDVFIIVYCDEHEEDPAKYPAFYVYHVGGMFTSTRGEEKIYWPANVPAEAQQATYRLTIFDLGLLSSEMEFILQELEKYAED
jgi:hypothetical protein